MIIISTMSIAIISPTFQFTPHVNFSSATKKRSTVAISEENDTVWKQSYNKQWNFHFKLAISISHAVSFSFYLYSYYMYWISWSIWTFMQNSCTKHKPKMTHQFLGWLQSRPNNLRCFFPEADNLLICCKSCKKKQYTRSTV